VTETPILVSNHVSYLDILVLGSLRPLSFVAKSDVRQWPALGWLVKQAGTVFVDRSKRTDVRRVTLEIAGKVKSGVGVILFPEGTSSDGRSVLPFRNSLLEPAASSGWPVLPICISYRCSEADPAREICWWGDMTLAPHVWRLFGFREIAAHVHFGSPVLNSDRKVLGSLLHNQVASLCREASTV
jgi:1-acyl-sn-glycerol-3-phosphate acyltransferase